MTDKATGAQNDYQTLSDSVATFGIEETTKPSKLGLGIFTWGLIILGLFLASASIIFGVTYYYEHQGSTNTPHAYANQWRDRSIYFLLTDRFACDPYMGSCTDCTELRSYCGGNFKGIHEKLDYITEMGFDAIWISPIPDNSADIYAGPGYHGYYARKLNEINSHFGDKNALKDLVHEAHNRGLLVMLDVVANHAGPSTVDKLNTFDPFNQPAHYHPRCSLADQMGTWSYPGDYTYAGYNQVDFEKCWVFDDPSAADNVTTGLPDLNTESSFVQTQLKNWVHKTINSYGFDGVRVDTTPYVPQWFLKDFTESAGVFAMGEVTSKNHSYTSDYQNSGSMTTVLSYPAYFIHQPVFLQTSGRQSMTNLATLYQKDQASYSNPYILGSFIDNHDNPRARDLAGDDTYLVLNALTYIWFYPGIPILYYGTEQGFEGRNTDYKDHWATCQQRGGGDPCNRQALWTSNYDTTNPFYQFVKTINHFRKAAKISKYPLVEISVADTHYAYIRGSALVITTNVGNATSTQTFDIGVTSADNTSPLASQLTPGEAHPPAVQWLNIELTNLLDQSDKIIVPPSGQISITLTDGRPKIYYPSATYNQNQIQSSWSFPKN